MGQEHPFQGIVFQQFCEQGAGGNGKGKQAEGIERFCLGNGQPVEMGGTIRMAETAERHVHIPGDRIEQAVVILVHVVIL